MKLTKQLEKKLKNTQPKFKLWNGNIPESSIEVIHNKNWWKFECQRIPEILRIYNHQPDSNRLVFNGRVMYDENIPTEFSFLFDILEDHVKMSDEDLSQAVCEINQAISNFRKDFCLD